MSSHIEEKMSSVEGQRVIQVLEDSLAGARFISVVTRDLRSRKDDVLDLCGPEATEQIFEHLDLMSEYNDQLETCGGNPKDKQMIDMTLRLQDSVRSLSRSPRALPGIVDKLVGMAMDTAMPMMATRFVETLEGLKQLQRQKMLTTVEEDSSRSNFLSNIERKEQQKQKEKKELETRLAAEKASRHKEVKQLTDQRDKLLAEIEEINSTTKAEMEFLEKSTAEQEGLNTTNHTEAVDALTKERDKLKASLTELVTNSQTEEEGMRGKKQLLNRTVMDLIGKYDEHMSEKKQQLERLEKMHHDDQRDIAEFEAYFARLEVEKAEREELLRIEAEKRAEEARAQKVLDDAAAKIQAYYRGIQTRKALAAPKPAKKKKKK